MPKKTRDWLIRWYEQAFNDYDRALVNLKRISETYGENYPDHKQVIDQIIIATITTQETLTRFRREMM